ncbi:N-acetylmuramoyl-L-alanine amidase, partial [Candidatus Gracilibacteria bacterium]|nr:N-acetylmuramoyl-L-alanine amidase [Candidatus Gracilibacteria bacterium]
MKKFLAILTCILILIGINPISNFISFRKIYTYETEKFQSDIVFNPIYSQETSIIKLPLKISYFKANSKFNFEKLKDTFVLKIKKNTQFDPTLSKLFFIVDGKKIESFIDTDGDERILQDEYYYTAPIFLDSRKNIAYEIESKNSLNALQVTLIGSDTKSYNEKIELAFPETNRVDAENNNIISRSDWGVDEELRFEDSEAWKKIFADQKKVESKPKTEIQTKIDIYFNNLINSIDKKDTSSPTNIWIKAKENSKKVTSYFSNDKNDLNYYNAWLNSLKSKLIQNHISINFPLQDTIIENITKENGRSLAWNIEKTKRVEKIIVHHTAGEYKNDADDATIIRGIYYYHAITRQWGDIGYNYIIGRNGKIYEGRAGGNYVVAAHTLWNNKSSVGISIIGNFQTVSLPVIQISGLEQAIGYLSKKYGIDLNKKSITHKECINGDSYTCILKDYYESNLIGHSNAGYTECPGNKVYNLLGDIRNTGNLYSSGLTYIENTFINTENILSKNTNTISSDFLNGSLVKIKLSYEGDKIQVKSYKDEKMKISIGNRKGYIGGILNFEKKGLDKIRLVVGNKGITLSELKISGEILEITSWSRIPSWDKELKYNDNKFRGSLIIYNDNGILTVVNELPIEDYLKGLAEISNDENEEKAKTILVAARSYALFYTDPANRKFPGKFYDGSDDPDVFQKYLGYGFEMCSSKITNLVNETNGIVIKYNGKLIKPWYFNQSDGKTLS